MKLIVSGQLKGNFKYKTFDFIRDNNLENEIFITGFVSEGEKNYLYKNSRMVVYPSLYEGFGFPLVEMISSELPVIVANKGSLPELAGNAGIIFDAERASNLAEKMIELARNHDLRNELKGQSKLRRGDFFGWDEYAIKLESLYQEIIHGNF